MKKTLFFLLALTAGMALRAQTFTAVNDDGVAIKYTVIADNAVEVARDSYTGRVVVPEQVAYEGTDYYVTRVATRAFYNSAAAYVQLPGTVIELGYLCFSSSSLDTVRFDSPQIPSTGNYSLKEIFGSQQLPRLTVIVPCGQLENWRMSGWRPIANIMSDCAHRLTVTSNYDRIVRYDSVVVDGMALNSNGYYEAGDSVYLWAERYNHMEGTAPVADRYGYFVGWSDGVSAMNRREVMPDHDVELVCLCDTMPYATLSASRITTPVYVFGTLGYNGLVSQQYFDDVLIYSFDENNDTLLNYPSTIFNSSLWVSTQDRSAVSLFFTQGTDFYPGPLRLDGTTDLETVRRFSRVWHVSREMIDYHIAHCGEEGYVVPDDIMTWPGNGAEGYAEQLAPYYDADGNGRYWAPAGDYPLILGDECVFSIFNDAWSQHTQSGSEPLGIEVHAMTYAFNEPQDSALWNTVFQHYDIYNRSGQALDEAYLGMWTDFDIGYAWDDYIGCDVQNSMYYGYNGSVSDQMFGNIHPAQGCIILAADGEPGMTSFLAYDNSSSNVNGEPTKTSDFYNYLQGNYKNGDAPWYGPNGAYHYMYPAGSDPEFPYIDELSEGNAPGDRRGVGGSGPYTIGSGAVVSFDAAYLTGWTEEQDCVGCSRSALIQQAPNVRRQWLRDTTDSGRPFLYMPYSAPHEVGIGSVDEASLRVYPNPTSGSLTVSLPTEADVQVLDMMGRLLMSRHASAGTLTLDLGSLPQGIYLLRAAGAVSRIVKK